MPAIIFTNNNVAVTVSVKMDERGKWYADADVTCNGKHVLDYEAACGEFELDAITAAEIAVRGALIDGRIDTRGLKNALAALKKAYAACDSHGMLF